MYWQEEKTDIVKQVPENVVDLVFAIRARTLPVDHAYDLSQCIQAQLDWIVDEPLAGIHTIHVAESANGWMRPDSADQVLYPSRRTKMVLRVPAHRIAETKALVGQILNLAGHEVKLEKVTVKKLSDITTIFSRYVVTDGTRDENEFLQRSVEAMKDMNVRPTKMLCGTEKLIATPDGDIRTRSLMLADLEFDESIILQEQGLGTHRHMGCGIFLPHKDINKISEDLG